MYATFGGNCPNCGGCRWDGFEGEMRGDMFYADCPYCATEFSINMEGDYDD